MKNLINKLDEYIFILDKYGELLFLNDKVKNEIRENERYKGSVGDFLRLTDNGKVSEQFIQDKLGQDVQLFLYLNNSRIKVKCSIGWDSFEGETCIFIMCKPIKEELYTKEHLEYILDKTPLMVAIKDVKKGYVYMNDIGKAFAKSLGKDYLGLNDDEIFEGMSKELVYNEDKKIIDTKRTYLENRVVNLKNGETKCYKSYKLPIINKKGDVTHIVKAVQDETLKKKLEMEIEKTYKPLNDLGNLITYGDSTSQYDCLQNIHSFMDKNINAEGVNILMVDKCDNTLKSIYNYGMNTNVITNNFIKLNLTEGNTTIQKLDSYISEKYKLQVDSYKLDDTIFNIEWSENTYGGFKPIEERKIYIKQMNCLKEELNIVVYILLF